MKKRALISVSDKTGIADFARELVNLDYELISTGGTLKHLKACMPVFWPYALMKSICAVWKR